MRKAEEGVPAGRLWSGKALFVVTVWGASFVATRIALESFSPYGLVSVRLVAGTAILILFALATRRPLLPRRDDMRLAAGLGVVLGVHILIQAIGLGYTTAISTGWIIGFTPVPIALGGRFLLGERIGGWGGLGVALATSGIVLIIASTTPGFAAARTGDALQLLSCLTWTVFTLAGAGAVRRNGALRVTIPASACGAAILVALTPWTGLLHAPLTARAIAAAAFLGVVCSGLGYVLWYAALDEHGASRLGSYLYLEPFVTVAVSAALLAEPVRASVIGGGLLVLLGVRAVAEGSRRRARAAETA